MTEDQTTKLIAAIRSISHGDSHPAGLELVSMALAKSDSTSVADALMAIAESLDNIATAINNTGE